MEFQDYTPQALRTLSPNFYGDTVKASALAELILMLRAAEEKITKLKRALFYGKPQEELTASEEEYKVTETYPMVYGKQGFDTLHSLLGIVGESIEALLGFIDETGELNEFEETGDLLWFLALFTSTRGVDVNRAMEANIAKLRARYPDKFDSDLSVNRDLDSEAEAMQEVLAV
jgi:NTP pyrophosphatase (non-canonical NTP hydrolase)